MSAGFGSIEAVLVGILGILLAVAIFFLLRSAQPDPKMHLLLSLLENLPHAEEESQVDDRKVRDGSHDTS